MATTWQQDNAFEALKAAEKVIRAAEGANEDTTRMRAIDTILFDVLKWDKSLVETEKYSRAIGFADYAFQQGADLCLILEAKRDGVLFALPDFNFGDRPVGFGVIAAQCPEAAAALRQACGYAANEGARYVAISNGTQWIIALAFVQGQAIENRSVFVFRSLDEIFSRFSRFWSCFSPEGVYSNACSTHLLESRKAPAPAKLSTRIINYPLPATRNSIVNELDYVIGIVWDKMDQDETDEKFLRECYIQPESSLDSLQEARELIEQRNKTDVTVTHEAQPITELPILVESYKAEKPIVVLGRVGHGKSTFLRYLRLIGASETLKKYIQIEINFLDRPDQESEVSEYVYGQIIEQLRTRYGIDVEDDKIVRPALNGDINRFKKSTAAKLLADDPKELHRAELAYILRIQENRHEFLAKVIYHLKQSQRWSIAIFFDNLDRREKLQEVAFLRASAIARDWTSLVFVCLRPGTFYKSSEGGILDTVAPKTLKVDPPRTDALLRKRLHYAARLAKSHGFGAAIAVSLPQTASVLECAANSFHRVAALRELFDAVSNGNVRELLKYVRAMLTSKHLDTKKILNELKQGSYYMPAHEALRALLFRDSMHFDPSTSTFANLFDIKRADPTEHFSRPLTLDLLNRAPQSSPTFGYMRVEEIVQALCQLGFSHEHATETIEYLYSKRCCESEVPDQNWTDVKSRDLMRITSLGEYHIKQLVRAFHYYDAIVVDTPIVDTIARESITDCMGINDRLERATRFARYLKKSAESLQDTAAVQCIDGFLDDALRDVETISATDKVVSMKNRGGDR